MNIVERIKQTEEVAAWLMGAAEPKRQLVTGLSGSAKTLLLAALIEKETSPVLIAVPNLYQGTLLADDLRHFLPEEMVHLFPVNEVTSAEMAFSSPESAAERVAALTALSRGEQGAIIVPAAGIRRFLPAPKVWQDSLLDLRVGGEIDFDHIAEQLVFMGYERQHMVGKPGDFSIRGSIIDIYPLTTAWPVRLDLFDTEVDSLRYFEVDTQRSAEQLDSIVITPARDLVYTKKDLALGSERIRRDSEKQSAIISDEQDRAGMLDYFARLTDAWDKGDASWNGQMYSDYLFPKKYTILDYLAPESVVVVDDYSRILEVEREVVREEAEWMTQKLAEHRVFPEQVFGGDLRALLKKVKQPQTFFSLFQKGMGHVRFKEVHPFQYRSMQQFFGQMPLLKAEMDRWRKREATVVVFAENEERRQYLMESFQDYQIHVSETRADSILTGEAQIVIGSIGAGFELPDENLVVITEQEIFHVQKKKRARRQTISNAERLKDYNELATGDYVVHMSHGIGKYVGMETIETDGVHQDYMTILYQNDDKLFIPVTQLTQIQKYVAAEGKAPKLSKLGGSEWRKTRTKVTAKIEDIADDLIALYAEREAEQGFAFSPDDGYQKAFEESFPYTETEDQLRSTAEIKRDMEKTKPMDRLLVGDVGYGKTEVALRAAFKAIQDDKQVVFLVPTTILAQQHYETMLDRFAGFPVKVGLLSRFRSKKDQTETINALRKGELDIVVGTHRLLSKDVVFQDLGLLIIDEEQRFGVKHKERLKQLRAQVDVLTLTATPIPRTLHMSMLGVRDLSVIETPPADRYPIQTYVMEKNLGAVGDAIEREMARGGQIFYLNNRIDTIMNRVEELQAMVPDARIAHAHGRMTEVQLENVLYDFVRGEYDVLVTTTIIETGVDIPNVNTLFVENADYMGLSTLYQLRGRVGRSNRVAYAYFMYEPEKILTEVSEKRLQAIKDFTELGSGFKIAMRDLSIRGAGNLLGSQQHGFIDAIGFDMYSQLLGEAVMQRQGKSQTMQKSNLEIDLEIDAYIPPSYIHDERQKIEIYKRVRQLETTEMADELESDLLDRFGEYPEEVANLLTVGRIKMDGELALLEKIARKKETVDCVISKQGMNVYRVEQYFEALKSTSLKASMGEEKHQMHIKLQISKGMKEAVWLQEVVSFTAALRQEKYQSKEKVIEG